MSAISVRMLMAGAPGSGGIHMLISLVPASSMSPSPVTLAMTLIFSILPRSAWLTEVLSPDSVAPGSAPLGSPSSASLTLVPGRFLVQDVSGAAKTTVMTASVPIRGARMAGSIAARAARAQPG